MSRIALKKEEVISSFGRMMHVGVNRRELFATAEHEVIPCLRVGTNFTLQHFSSLGGGSSAAHVPLWQLSLERQVWKDKPHYLKLSAADLLNQNRCVQQEALGFLVRETQGNVLGRYAVISGHWRL